MAWKLQKEKHGKKYADAYWVISQATDCPLAQTATIVFAAFGDAKQREKHREEMAASGVSSVVCRHCARG